MVPKNQIFTFYIILTIVFTISGYQHGKQTNNSNSHAFYGFILGLVISIILWETWGKANSY